MSKPRKASYAQEVMLRVSWSVLNHADGQPQHARRGEVMLDLGLESAPDPELTNDEMQRVAYAAKMAALKALSKRPKVPKGRRAYSDDQIDKMADDGRLNRIAMQMAIDAGHDWLTLDYDDQDEWNMKAIDMLRSARRPAKVRP